MTTRQTKKFWLMALAAWLSLALQPGAARAQTGGPYNLTWNTWDNSGGVTFATGGAYSLGGTAGQADSAFLTGGGYTLSGGFWYNPYVTVFVPNVIRGVSSGW